MDSSETFAIVAAIAAPLATLAGVLLGSSLSRRTAREIAQDERAWAEQESVRTREVEVAARFDAEVMEVMADVPMGSTLGGEAVDAIEEAWRGLRSAWRRTTVLDDAGIEGRIAALDMAIFIAQQDARFRKDEEINFWPLSIATQDLRKALAAFQRRQPLPEPEFPSAKALIQLAHPGGRNVGIDGATEWLIEQGVT